MKKTFIGKRFASALLVLVMIFTFIPATAFSAFATETASAVDYLFMATDRHENTSVIGNLLTQMENEVGDGAIDYVGLGGDMVNNTNSYNTSTILSEVTAVASNLGAEAVDIVYAASHDVNANDDAGIMNKESGLMYETDHAYIYGVIETDVQTANSAETAAAAFVTWANGEDIDTSKVIIVLSHFPIHAKRGDNAGAGYWHNALNAVATGSESGGEVIRNVIFLHGHNHTEDSTEYFYEVGDTMSVESYVTPEGSTATATVTYTARVYDSETSTYATSSGTDATIYYTYATAGYLDKNNQATLITITDSTITLDKYTTSGYTKLGTVERAAKAVTPTQLAVTAVTEYTVGATIQDPTAITVTYSDGSTRSLSASDVTLTITTTDGAQPENGVFTKAGTYNFTYSYTEGGYTASATLEVTVKEDNADWKAIGLDVDSTTVYTVGDELTFTKIVLSYQVEGDETIYYKELTLDECDVTISIPYGSATTEEYAMANVGTYQAYVTYTLNGKTVSASEYFYVYTASEFTDESTGIDVSVANNFISSVTVTENDSTQAIEGAINYTAYDITPTGTLKAGNYVTITFPVPEGYGEGTNVVKVYCVDTDEWFEDTDDDPDTVTVRTSHFSTWAVVNTYGEGKTGVVENYTSTTGGTTTQTVYVLADTITSGNNYLIVNVNTGDGYALVNNSGSVAYVEVTVQSGSLTIDGTTSTQTYITLDNANAIWTAGTNNSSSTFKNGSYYLYHDSGALSLSTSTSKNTWTWNSGNNYLYYTGGNTTRYLTYSEEWTLTTDAASVYIYEQTTATVDTTVTVEDTVSLNAGDDQTVVIDTTEGATNTVTIDPVILFAGEDATATFEALGGTYTYAVISDLNGILTTNEVTDGVFTLNAVEGTATIRVYYTWYVETTDEEGNKITTPYTIWDTVEITTTLPYYSIDITDESKPIYGEDGTTVTGYESVTDVISIKGEEAMAAGYDLGYLVTLTGSSGTSTVTPADDTIEWISEDPAIATVDENGKVTFTGREGSVKIWVSYQVDEDTVVYDSVYITVSKTLYTTPEDGTDDFPEYPNEGAVRHDKTATAVGNFSETGVAKVELSMTGVPVNTGNELDVVIMLDMTGSMTDASMSAAEAAAIAFAKQIVINEDGSYNNNRIEVQCFSNSGVTTLWELNAVTADTYANLVTAIEGASDKRTEGGTPYSTALQSCYETLYAASQEDGYDRQQFCVFVSDGTPTSVTYITDTTTPTNTTTISFTKDSTTYEQTVLAYTTGNTAATFYGSVGYHEYWSQLMINNGVTVFGVYTSAAAGSTGTSGGGSVNDTTTGTIAMTNVASSSDNVYVVKDYTDTSAVEGALTDIAQKILAAATDLTAADKIGDGYTMIFGAPNSVVDTADGGQEYYIEVTDYALVPMYAYTLADGVTEENFGDDTYYTKGDDGTYTEATAYASDTDYYTRYIADYNRGTATTLLKLYFAYDSEDGYYAATDAAGTAAATPVFDTVTLGEKGTKYYWTTDSTQGDSGISVVDANNVTYYFISTGNGTHNMVSGAYASGTLTTDEVYSLADIDSFADDVTYYVKDSETGKYVVNTEVFNKETKYYTMIESSTCEDMIIASPYFVYNAETKMLIWTIDEISSNEITLTYFLYLDNSGGYAGTDTETAPETYETNQFAYVTYTNYKGTECKLTFPVPQMTWNGAQVSYVFYLVNEAGQPVNRAGRVVPFSEAVYVTDTYLYKVVWNSLEQSAGLEADYLASDIVPSIYDLYDDDASYDIHVYEDQTAYNLNNHFIIGGAIDDDYNVDKGWTNPYTTVVYNTKADGTKYYAYGAYVANNGNDTNNESGLTYLCKSYDVEGTFTYETRTDPLYGEYRVYTVESATYNGDETQWVPGEDDSVTGGTQIGDYVYYVDENEQIYTIVVKEDGNEVYTGFDFHNTTVAFAVVWRPVLKEDTVVIDFGLDVIVDVYANDGLAEGVTGVMLNKVDGVEINEGSYDTNPVGLNSITSADGIWTASVESQHSIRFHLNSMEFNSSVTFYYEVYVSYYQDTDYTTAKTTYMYSSVTVIPATTIYYEDSYVDLESYSGTAVTDESGNTTVTWNDTADEETEWAIVYDSTTVTTNVQDTDRPGENVNNIMGSLYDADNLYGYDSAYENMSEYSLGSAAMINVNATTYGTATFTFYGTGFDVIALTSNKTGTIVVQVFDDEGASVKSLVVDTYYSYYYDSEKGEWVVSSANDSNVNNLYQIPVMKVDELEYGKYTVVISVAHAAFFDHGQYDGTNYDFYLDAIRIYDPANDGAEDPTAEDAYIADGEYLPDYYELRNLLITAEKFNSLGDTTVNGVVFIDGNAELGDDEELTQAISDYINYGPNNELYLASGQAIAFDLGKVTETIPNGYTVARIELAVKSVGGTALAKVWSAADESVDTAEERTIATATDMYYDITYLMGSTVVIMNSGAETDAILSVTNIKVTYEPAETVTESVENGTTNVIYTAEYSLVMSDGESEALGLITVCADSVAIALASMEEPEPVFVPEKLVVNGHKGKVFEGDRIKLEIITSDDVEYITVNGTVIDNYKYNRKTGERIFSVMITADEAGETELQIVAYDAEDIGSEAVVHTVTVEEHPANKIRNMLEEMLGKFFGGKR